MDQLKKDEIPLENLISALTDSASYMIGCKTGFLTQLKKVAPNLLDIDNDICHHIHNSVKKFCSHFGTIEKLCDDIHTDFDYGTDLGHYLEEICLLLGFPFVKPKERVPHRWLSVYNCAVELKDMFLPYTVFYFSFLSCSDKTLFNSSVLEIFKKASQPSRKRIYIIMKILKDKMKSMTPAGKDRKKRITEKIFFQNENTTTTLNMYLSVLPMFKSFVLSLESKEPRIHTLHDRLEDLFRNFLLCFMKPEVFKDLSVSQLASLNISQDMCLPDKLIFVSSLSNKCHSSFLTSLKTAYLDTAVYLQTKLPLKNKVLRYLSAIDPRAVGFKDSFQCLTSLLDFLPAMFPEGKTKQDCIEDIRKLQLAQLPPYENTGRLDIYWSKFMASSDYPKLWYLFKACLSIFSGPRVESSFSIMNNIITAKTNRLHTSTYCAIQKVKYHLLSIKKSSIELFHRDNVATDPVDKALLYHMQTARKNDKSRLQKQKEDSKSKCQGMELVIISRRADNCPHTQAKKIKERLLKRSAAPLKSSSSRKRRRLH